MIVRLQRRAIRGMIGRTVTRCSRQLQVPDGHVEKVFDLKSKRTMP
jgi:hypothetical protein